MEWVLAAYIGAAQTASAPIGGVSHDGYEWGALSLQTAAGMEWRTYRGFAAAAEYKFTRIRQNVTVAGGDTCSLRLTSCRLWRRVALELSRMRAT